MSGCLNLCFWDFHWYTAVQSQKHSAMVLTASFPTNSVWQLLWVSPVCILFHSSVVLGHPWLLMHSPAIDLSDGCVISWSNFSLSTCSQSAVPLSADKFTPPPPDQCAVAGICHDVGDVLSNTQASSLLFQLPFDLPKDLLLCVPLPPSHLYNLFVRGYIEVSYRGFI